MFTTKTPSYLLMRFNALANHSKIPCLLLSKRMDYANRRYHRKPKLRSNSALLSRCQVYVLNAFTKPTTLYLKGQLILT
jgi:hypothetical protein